MDIKLFFEKLSEIELQQNVPLAPYTTWKIGGNAEYLLEVETAKDLLKVMAIVFTYDIPFTLLGKASNVLISDSGLKGLTIINRTRTIHIPEVLSAGQNQQKDTNLLETENPYIPHRHSETGDQRFYSFNDLEFLDEAKPIQITFDSGLELASAITATTKQKLSGLQWFAGIPGTIGGSLYNNIHGGTKHFSDNFVSARLIIPRSSAVVKIVQNNLEAKIVNESEKWLEIEAKFGFFGFGYDQSILRIHPEIIVLSVTMNMYPRNDDKALEVAREWLKRKRIQPKKSCGSVFQCITPEEQEKNGFPTASVGYIVDHILGLKGTKSGDVCISDKHANFIENIGSNAKAADVLKLIKMVKKQTLEKTDLHIHPEINFLGFTDSELQNIL